MKLLIGNWIWSFGIGLFKKFNQNFTDDSFIMGDKKVKLDPTIRTLLVGEIM